MEHPELNRRAFNRLTVAAFGGLVAGSVIGCAKEEEAPGKAAGTPPKTEEGPGAESAAPAKGEEVAAADAHVCRGLNTCKGKGASGDNACAGQGSCATAEHHGCHGENACKGQGGCGDTAGENACKGQGECAVPLGDEAWQKARERFETRMTEQGKDFGEPPPAS